MRHPPVIPPQCLTVGALHIPRSVTDITFVRHNTLRWPKTVEKAVPKDSDVIVLTSRVGSFNPDQVTFQNREPNLIPQRRLSLIFKRCKCIPFPSAAFLGDAEVCAINAHEAVIPAATILSAFKINLIIVCKTIGETLCERELKGYYSITLTTSENKSAIARTNSQTHFRSVLGSMAPLDPPNTEHVTLSLA